MIIISDTSPITNLLAIEHIHLLPALYSRIIIPEGVREELLRVESRKEKIQVFHSFCEGFTRRTHGEGWFLHGRKIVPNGFGCCWGEMTMEGRKQIGF